MRLLNPNTGRAERSNSWLSTGNVYDVLEISGEPGQICHLRLIGDDGRTPALHDLRQFEVVSPTIPPSWVFSSSSTGYFELSPASWLESGFWERYFDRDPEAMRIFEEERAKILETDA